jgi:hypothetical protein
MQEMKSEVVELSEAELDAIFGGNARSVCRCHVGGRTVCRCADRSCARVCVDQ